MGQRDGATAWEERGVSFFLSVCGAGPTSILASFFFTCRAPAPRDDSAHLETHTFNMPRPHRPSPTTLAIGGGALTILVLAVGGSLAGWWPHGGGRRGPPPPVWPPRYKVK